MCCGGLEFADVIQMECLAQVPRCWKSPTLASRGRFHRARTDRPRAGREATGETAFNLLLALGVVGNSISSRSANPRESARHRAVGIPR